MDSIRTVISDCLSADLSLSIPLNGFGFQGGHPRVLVELPFNSIEWILVPLLLSLASTLDTFNSIEWILVSDLPVIETILSAFNSIEWILCCHVSLLRELLV